ncbi:MAG: hypothetical protein WD651_03990 [Acidimicrobiia bacterium]
MRVVRVVYGRARFGSVGDRRELSAFELTTLPPRRAVTVSGDIEVGNVMTVTGPAGALFSLDLEASQKGLVVRLSVGVAA